MSKESKINKILNVTKFEFCFDFIILNYNINVDREMKAFQVAANEGKLNIS